MDVSNATSTQSKSTISGAQLNQDFDQFLQLLTTQLQNQDPLEPMDSSEFTNQLVQFSSVEQQIRTNSYLENLISAQTLNLTALGVSFIGKNVEMQGKYFDMDGTKGAELSYGLPLAANTGTLTVLNENGDVVYSGNIELEAGRHTFKWDGKDNSGTPVPAGQYELRVGALGENNVAINPTTFVPGYVSGLESAGDGSLLLRVGDQTIPMSNVTKIFESPTT